MITLSFDYGFKSNDSSYLPFRYFSFGYSLLIKKA